MSSYQDLDTRVGQIERRLDFLFSLTSVTKREPSMVAPLGYTERRMTMEQLYRELSNEGAIIEAAVELPAPLDLNND